MNEALSMRLQPLRKCLWGCHTSSFRPASGLELAEAAFAVGAQPDDFGQGVPRVSVGSAASAFASVQTAMRPQLQ